MRSVDDWWSASKAKQLAAEKLIGGKRTAREAYHITGFSVEFALKAVIMKQKRFNQWPEQRQWPDLYKHNLKKLLEYIDYNRGGLEPELRANLKIVCDWDRGHDYSVNRMPRRVAEDMYEAAFGEKGVIQWLKTL